MSVLSAPSATFESTHSLPHNVGTSPTISIVEEVSLIYVERRGIDRLFDCVGRTFVTLANLHVEVLLTSQSCAAGNFRFVIPARHTFEVLNALKEEFQDEFESGEVTLIGAKNDVALIVQQATACNVPTLYDALAQAHVNVLAAQGSPASSVSVVIDKHDLPKLVVSIQTSLSALLPALSFQHVPLTY